MVRGKEGAGGLEGSGGDVSGSGSVDACSESGGEGRRRGVKKEEGSWAAQRRGGGWSDGPAVGHGETTADAAVDAAASAAGRQGREMRHTRGAAEHGARFSNKKEF